MSIPNTNIQTNENFGAGSNAGTDLVTIFPFTKFYTMKLGGSAQQTTGYFSFPSGEQFGTQYAVYSSVIYNWEGSGGTYNQYQQGFVPVITNRQNNGFQWNVGSGTGDNKNVYIIFMVTYSADIPGNDSICDFNQSVYNSTIPSDGTGVVCD